MGNKLEQLKRVGSRERLTLRNGYSSSSQESLYSQLKSAFNPPDYPPDYADYASIPPQAQPQPHPLLQGTKHNPFCTPSTQRIGPIEQPNRANKPIKM